MAVSEPAKHETKATTFEKPAAKAAGPLARASESGDPAVHQAMAVLDGALMNRAALDVAAGDIEKADEQVDAARKALAELGYE
jgi:hypothetical protein